MSPGDARSDRLGLKTFRLCRRAAYIPFVPVTRSPLRSFRTVVDPVGEVTMKTKLAISALAGLLALTGFGSALAKGKPGGGTMPPQSAYGLCKAYFSGSENGQAHKRNAPPFRDLAAKAAAANQSVEDFCAAQTPGNK